MIQKVHIDSKLGEFELLINEEDLDLTRVGLRVHRTRVQSGAIIYMATASKNRFNRKNSDCRFMHILVAEKCLRRSLKKIEIVHHLNTNTFDCTRGNLLVCKNTIHSYLHMQMGCVYAQEHFQSPLSDGQLQLLHQLLDRNTQDISGVRLAL